MHIAKALFGQEKLPFTKVGCRPLRNPSFPKAKLLAVYLAYVSFAKRHPDLFAVMFQSGIDKTTYSEVQVSAAKAFELATKLPIRSNQRWQQQGS